jgi:hypothetical protein
MSISRAKGLNKTACHTEAEVGIKQNDACMTDSRQRENYRTAIDGEAFMLLVSAQPTLCKEKKIYFREPVG